MIIKGLLIGIFRFIETAKKSKIIGMSKGGPKGINWTEALKFYLTPSADGTMPSYQEVADKFNVSKKEVGLKARRESWVQRRQNVYDEAENLFVENKTNLIAETIKEHIGYWRQVQDLANDFLTDINEKISIGKATLKTIKDLAQITGVFKLAIEGERTALGLPNTITNNNQETARQEITLSPELIQEIDRMYRLNSDI